MNGQQQAVSTQMSTTRNKPGRKSIPLAETEKLPHARIHEALFFMEDILERSQIPFLVLDELAKRVYEQEDPSFTGIEEVTLGIMSPQMTPSCVGTLKSLIPSADWSESTIDYDHHGVPVVIWIIHNHLDVFKNPDTKFYYTTQLRIPNPFNTYWKSRDLIK